MIIAAAKMSFERLSMFTLLSLCVNGIVARKLSAYIYGSARTGGAPRISREDLRFPFHRPIGHDPGTRRAHIAGRFVQGTRLIVA